ncbi:MAG: DNA cytosine methyltransferase, partial [Vicinamibacterales bacterium]
MRVIDCQGLAGSFTLGCVVAGFELVGVRALPGGFGVDNLETNRDVLGNGWEVQIGPEEEWEPARVELVAGNPPCSGFSGLNTSKGAMTRGPDSKINDCMWSFAKYAARCQPQVAVFESVQAAGKDRVRGGRQLMRDMWNYVCDQSGVRYGLTHLFMSGAAVGAAQMRHRYFWVLSAVPFGVELPELQFIATYAHAIGDLVGLDNQWESQELAVVGGSWLVGAQHAHGIPKLNTDATVDAHVWPTEQAAALRYQVLYPHWRPGETLKEAAQRYQKRYGRAPRGWPEKNWRNIIAPDHWSINGIVRVRWDRPGYVITGAGGWSFVHPEENRLLSLRECARLMGFPDEWTWTAARSV